MTSFIMRHSFILLLLHLWCPCKTIGHQTALETHNEFHLRKECFMQPNILRESNKKQKRKQNVEGHRVKRSRGPWCTECFSTNLTDALTVQNKVSPFISTPNAFLLHDLIKLASPSSEFIYNQLIYLYNKYLYVLAMKFLWVNRNLKKSRQRNNKVWLTQVTENRFACCSNCSSFFPCTCFLLCKQIKRILVLSTLKSSFLCMSRQLYKRAWTLSNIPRLKFFI